MIIQEYNGQPSDSFRIYRYCEINTLANSGWPVQITTAKSVQREKSGQNIAVLPGCIGIICFVEYSFATAAAIHWPCPGKAQRPGGGYLPLLSSQPAPGRLPQDSHHLPWSAVSVCVGAAAGIAQKHEKADVQELTPEILKEVTDSILVGHINRTTKLTKGIQIHWRLWCENTMAIRFIFSLRKKGI